MSLINPKPRFGYDPLNNTMYDYVRQRDVPLTADYQGADGIWDLNLVKDLILTGQPIEAARIKDLADPTPIPNANNGTPSAPTAPTDPIPKAAISVAELATLHLSPLQLAALGITEHELTHVGVSAAQVAAWDMTTEKANALKLTQAQRKVLLP